MRNFLFCCLLAVGLVARGEEEKRHLPRVLIIGDSISIGYTKPLKELMAGLADVSHNPGNAQHSRFGKEQLDRWLGGGIGR